MSPISTQEQGYDEQSFHASYLSAHLKVILQESGQIWNINSMFLSFFFSVGYHEEVLGEGCLGMLMQAIDTHGAQVHAGPQSQTCQDAGCDCLECCFKWLGKKKKKISHSLSHSGSTATEESSRSFSAVNLKETPW